MIRKYHNTKVKVDGETFDSKKEARRYCELKLLSQAGEIGCLRRQVRYHLLPAQYDERTGKCIERAVDYVADFVYQTDGFTVVEDTKGMRTPEYIIKRKMMLYFHGIRIQEV